MKALNRLARACGKLHQSYSDFVIARRAARGPVLGGVRIAGRGRGLGKNLVVIRRQFFYVYVGLTGFEPATP